MPDVDEVDEAAGEVSVTCVPSGSVVVVVTDPSLLVTDVEELSAAANGSELELPLELLDPSALLDPSGLATWWWPWPP